MRKLNSEFRFVVTSDWHLDAITAGKERFEEIERAATHVVRYAILEKADAFVFMGDLCNPMSARAHRADEVVVRLATDLGRAGVRSYWLVGNHDVIEDGRGTHTLKALEGLVRNDDGGMVNVFDAGTILSPHPGAAFMMLPYPAATHGYDLPALIESIKTTACSTLMVFSHYDIAGAFPGSESRDMKRGRGVLLPVGLIRDTAIESGKRVFFMNGHYHAAQDIAGVKIPGSIARLRFDEETNEPGFYSCRFDGANLTTNYHLVPYAASMATWTGPKGKPADFIRLKMKRAAGVRTIEELKSQGIDVKLDTLASEDEFFAEAASSSLRTERDPRTVALMLADESPANIRLMVRAVVEAALSKAGI